MEVKGVLVVRRSGVGALIQPREPNIVLKYIVASYSPPTTGCPTTH